MNMDFKSAEELLNLCEENQLPISEVMRQRECLLGEVPRDSVNTKSEGFSRSFYNKRV